MMEKVGPILTLEKWVPVFWIIGLCVGFFVVLMLLDYLKTKKRKG
jgi:beta-lactamase regulating signal transducer with metallopeptidase domain